MSVCCGGRGVIVLGVFVLGAIVSGVIRLSFGDAIGETLVGHGGGDSPGGTVRGERGGIGGGAVRGGRGQVAVPGGIGRAAQGLWAVQVYTKIEIELPSNLVSQESV
ncbi:unnamed protein product [Boreogadus saida]